MLRLKLIVDSPIPVEAECLRPDELAKLSLAEIASLPVHHGNRTEKLGEFFTITGDPSRAELLIEGDASRIKHIGQGMTGGQIAIDGNAGLHLGAGMRGGSITVHGDAGDWLGAEMINGHIHIRGNAGNCVGAAYRGGKRGMRGGQILINGNAGHEIGASMRRGLIAVRGDIGDFAGTSMIAGTIFALRNVGARAGAGMKRGTIVSFRPITLPPTFAYDCEMTSVFVSLYLRKLQEWGFDVPTKCMNRTFRRYSGDRLALGKGEIVSAS